MLESQDRQKTATQDREIQPPTKRHWWLIDLAAVVFLLVVFSWSLAMIDYPISPLPSAGERWGTSSASDFTIMIAGRNFHKEGFANNYFLSNEAVGYPEFARNWLADELPETDRGPRIYETRYGSTDSIVNRLLRYFDVEDITSFYRVSALVSILALGLWYASASLLFGRAIGLISLVFMGTAPIFLSHIDTLTYIPYDYLLAFGALLLFLLAMRQSQDNRRKWPLLGGAWLLTALQGFTALEFLLWLQAFFIGYLWITRNSFPHRWQLIALMASASFSGLVLRFSFAAWALGGLGNAWDSVWLTLTSSSVGFGLAAEAPFGEFSWSAMLSNVERGLWSNTHIELVGLIVLLVLAAWLTRKLQSQLQPSQAARLRAQLRLLPAFLIGGIAYWVLFLHSGVSQHPLALRTVLPFAGLLVAYSANITWHFILMERQRYLQKGTALAAVIAVLLPATAGIVSGSNFDFPRYTQSPDYYGRTSNEVKIVSEFIHENTRYGDVVLTNLNIGNTGLRGYPFAGYEYLSERRLESARDLPQLIESLTELEATRQPLPLSNPASEVDFYVLMDAPTRSLPYGWLVYQIAESVSVLDTGAWWANHRGGIPPGEDQNQFFLYRIDQSAIEESSLREQADDIQRMGATAAWTKISNMRILPDGEIEPWDARGIFDIKSASNGILAMKTGDYNTGFLGRVEDGFDNDTGSTVEVKLKLLDASLHGFQRVCIALQNGEREGKLSFYPDHITIQDANEEKASFEMDTTDDFHIYRLAIVEDTQRVYVDGEEVTGVALKNVVNSKAVIFGDLSPEEGENIYAEIDYLAYSVEGAFAPDGSSVDPVPAPTTTPSAWSKMSDMVVLPDSESHRPWGPGGSFDVWQASDGIFTIKTGGTNTGFLAQGEVGFNNEIGSTVEVKLKLLDASLHGFQGACIILQDGKREGKLSFYPDYIIIQDASDKKASFEMDTTDDLHIYRLAMVEDTLRVYVDGEEVTGVYLRNDVNSKAVMFGDLSPEEDENIYAEIDYLAYSVEGAFAPDGSSVDPVPAPTTTPSAWSKMSDMVVLPDSESHRPWGPGGSFDVWQASDGIFTIKTGGTNTGFLAQGEVGFNNEIGSTVEVKLKLLDASLHGFQGACIILQDGEREGKLSFYPDYIIIRDANTEKASFEMDTTDDFHIYRLAMIEDTMRVYVDGEEVTGVYLRNEVKSKAVMFGDLSPEEDENIYAEIDYLAYSAEGAFAPDGSFVDPVPAPTPSMWSKESDMVVLPDSESPRPWGPGGSFDVWQVSDGIFTIKTGGTNTGFLAQGEDGFDNDTGSTVEVKLKLLDASLHGFQGACIALQNGEREGKLSFYPDHIIIRDANTEKASFEMDTMDDFHIYRLAIIEDTLRVYVDGEEVAGVALKNEVNNKAVIFGDLSQEEDENIYAEIDYLAYSAEGAFAPDDTRLSQ